MDEDLTELSDAELYERHNQFGHDREALRLEHEPILREVQRRESAANTALLTAPPASGGSVGSASDPAPRVQKG